ncbi:hypothetical protein MAPG_04875 [Magnaporthiopsis poae ATCC 64411]|uniref:Uncharacterized protein n=1 Tax=Magnaporthiopsis poae (strain ATCC 64411 / 73-15) TaxID=644358 RepID=A0A0C4DXW8_MAGP6|nr:hypothetical protein MAPG_04875 [Magnaporthiopsis poae ATCC 64411]
MSSHENQTGDDAEMSGCQLQESQHNPANQLAGSTQAPAASGGRGGGRGRGHGRAGHGGHANSGRGGHSGRGNGSSGRGGGNGGHDRGGVTKSYGGTSNRGGTSRRGARYETGGGLTVGRVQEPLGYENAHTILSTTPIYRLQEGSSIGDVPGKGQAIGVDPTGDHFHFRNMTDQQVGSKFMALTANTSHTRNDWVMSKVRKPGEQTLLADIAQGVFGSVLPAGGKAKALPAPEGACAGCGLKDHVLADCVKVSIAGDIVGCPVCNTLEHDVDGCKEFRALSRMDQMELIILKRARKPCIRSTKPWTEWLPEYVEIHGEDEEEAWLPLSRPFVSKLRRRNPGLFQTWNYGSTDGRGIAVDPRTRTVQNVRVAADTGFISQYETDQARWLREKLEKMEKQVALAKADADRYEQGREVIGQGLIAALGTSHTKETMATAASKGNVAAAPKEAAAPAIATRRLADAPPLSDEARGLSKAAESSKAAEPSKGGAADKSSMDVDEEENDEEDDDDFDFDFNEDVERGVPGVRKSG